MAASDDPLRGMRRPTGELDQVMIELWGGTRTPPGAAMRAPADVYATGDPPALIVQLAVAGADPERLHVEIEGSLLTIRGQRVPPPAAHRTYHHAEIDWGPFERRLRLNVPVDAEGVTAAYERGVLSIALPIVERVRDGRIEISVRGRVGG